MKNIFGVGHALSDAEREGKNSTVDKNPIEHHVLTMTPRLWVTPFIFLGGYFPLMVILIVHNFDTEIMAFANPWRVLLLLALFVISVGLTMLCLKRIEGGHPVVILSAKERTGSLMEYSLPYLLCFLDVELADNKSLISLGIFLLFFYYMGLKTHTLFLSPLLIVLQYRLYEVEYQDTKVVKNALILTGWPLLKGDACRVENFAPETLFVADEPNSPSRTEEAEQTPEEPAKRKPQKRSRNTVGGASKSA